MTLDFSRRRTLAKFPELTKALLKAPVCLFSRLSLLDSRRCGKREIMVSGPCQALNHFEQTRLWVSLSTASESPKGNNNALTCIMRWRNSSAFLLREFKVKKSARKKNSAAEFLAVDAGHLHRPKKGQWEIKTSSPLNMANNWPNYKIKKFFALLNSISI